MFGAILKATNSSFQKGITFCRSIYVKKVMKLLAFIFEQPSYDNVVIWDIGEENRNRQKYKTTKYVFKFSYILVNNKRTQVLSLKGIK